MRQGGILNRRHLMAGGVAAVLTSRLSAEPAAEPPSVSFTDNSLLSVDVSLNGRGPYRFVVDTGADCTVLADTVGRDLGLVPSGSVRVRGIVRTMETATVEIAKLETGSIRQSDLALPVLPRELLDADGYLGLDILDGHRVFMDFRNGLLRLMDPRSTQQLGPDAPQEVRIKMGGSGGHLRSTNCLVDGVRCTAFVDTGAEISVGNSVLFQRLLEKSPDYRQTDTIPLTGVTGGVVSGGVANIKEVKFGGLSFEDSRIAIADLQIFRLWELQDTPSLFIGMNWLRRFNRVSVDYGRKELRFDLNMAGRETPWRCPAPGKGDCRYLLGEPMTMPRPSVAT